MFRLVLSSIVIRFLFFFFFLMVSLISPSFHLFILHLTSFFCCCFFFCFVHGCPIGQTWSLLIYFFTFFTLKLLTRTNKRRKVKREWNIGSAAPISKPYSEGYANSFSQWVWVQRMVGERYWHKDAWPIHWLVDGHINLFVDWLIDWMIDWLFQWVNHSLSEWVYD